MNRKIGGLLAWGALVLIALLVIGDLAWPWVGGYLATRKRAVYVKHWLHDCQTWEVRSLALDGGNDDHWTLDLRNGSWSGFSSDVSEDAGTLFSPPVRSMFHGNSLHGTVTPRQLAHLRELLGHLSGKQLVAEESIWQSQHQRLLAFYQNDHLMIYHFDSRHLPDDALMTPGGL